MRRWHIATAALCAVIAVAQACQTPDNNNTPTPRLVVTSSPSTISNGQSSTVTLIATDAAGAAGTGTVSLSINTGSVSPDTVTLDADGEATATVTCDDTTPCTGSVRVTAVWNAVTVVRVVNYSTGTVGGGTDAGTDGGNPGPDSGTPVGVGPPAAIGWDSTKCGGQDCTLLGIKTSGWNEAGQVSFRIVDASDNPVPDVAVTFSLVNAPAGTTLVSTTANSNANGIVVARVTSGIVVGAFAVRATVSSPALTGTSPNIGVRGAKPSNQGFSFNCELINLKVYTTEQSPMPTSIDCSVGISDRYNNPIGTGAAVYFKTEAGMIGNETATTAYEPGGANEDEGTGTVVYRVGSGGNPFPVWTDVLLADGAQWPSARQLEPSIGARNPRDQVVTVLAYTNGEEYFWDEDGDAVHDSGERFIDQGEPFLDSDDDNARDPDEFFVDADQDGVYDGPNSAWDGNTVIWTEKRFVWTGYPAGGGASYLSSSSFAGLCGTGTTVNNAEVVSFSATFRDYWLNLPAIETTLSVDHVLTKGEVDVSPEALLDNYGFGYERLLVDATTAAEGPCRHGATTRCKWKTLFYGWTMPASVVVTGADPGDLTGCADDTVTVTMTVGEVSLSLSATGGIE